MAHQRRFGQDWLNLLLGVWLFLSPLFAVGVGAREATINAGISGMVVATIALFSLTRWRPWQEWTNVAVGAWLVVAPFALEFTELTAALWNHVAVGAAVMLLAGWALYRRRAHLNRRGR